MALWLSTLSAGAWWRILPCMTRSRRAATTEEIFMRTIMLTLRQATPEGLRPVKTREWNSRENIAMWREAWQAHANHALERTGTGGGSITGPQGPVRGGPAESGLYQHGGAGPDFRKSMRAEGSQGSIQ